MSNVHRVQNILIGDGTALPAGGSDITSSTVASGDLALAGIDMEAMSPGDTVAVQEAFYVFEGRTSTTSPLKRSMKVPGRQVTSYLGQSYKPAARDVWAIGYNRQSAAGSIDVNNDVDYNFSITFKNNKQLYSERALKRSFSIRSAAAATQLSIATQITSAINADGICADAVTAVNVGNGTGAYGLTGATAWGVEITADLQTQDVTSYRENRVYFTVNIDDFASGFETTTIGQIENMTYGKGTYAQVSLLEKSNIAGEGVLNFTKFPIPTQIYAANSTLVTSSNVTATTGNVSVTINLDRGSVVTSNAILRAGEIIDVNGTQYEIKYLISTTEFVLTTVASATYSGANLKVKYGYDSIAIEFSNPNIVQGPGVLQDNLQSIVICTPAIASAGAYNVSSQQGIDLLAILNPYMASLGFANLTL